MIILWHTDGHLTYWQSIKDYGEYYLCDGVKVSKSDITMTQEIK